MCILVNHVPTIRPEMYAKERVGAKKIDVLKAQGIIVQFQHTVAKFQHLRGFAAVEAAQAETDEAVRQLLGTRAFEKLQADNLRFLSLALYQGLKQEVYELGSI